MLDGWLGAGLQRLYCQVQSVYGCCARSARLHRESRCWETHTHTHALTHNTSCMPVCKHTLSPPLAKEHAHTHTQKDTHSQHTHSAHSALVLSVVPVSSRRHLIRVSVQLLASIRFLCHRVPPPSPPNYLPPCLSVVPPPRPARQTFLLARYFSATSCSGKKGKKLDHWRLQTVSRLKPD